MSNEPTMPAENETERPEVAIVRDSTFGRFVADNVLVFHMGRDIELGFLQEGPMVVSRQKSNDEEGGVSFQLAPSSTEVARIRLSPTAAVTLSLSVLKDVVENDDVHPEGLLDTIKKIIAEHPDYKKENMEDSDSGRTE